MPTIYLLRHCEYENPRTILPGRLPVPLSEIGKQKAEKLRTFFLDKKITTIYSSEVLRCKQTAEIISGGTIPVVYDKRLLETFSAYQGYWEPDMHKQGLHFFSHREELGGESLEDIQKRMVDFWNEKIVTAKENSIICSHGDPLLALYSHIHQVPLVDENSMEDEIPGWLEKGEYMEVEV